jgi:hypothetical protein
LCDEDYQYHKRYQRVRGKSENKTYTLEGETVYQGLEYSELYYSNNHLKIVPRRTCDYRYPALENYYDDINDLMDNAASRITDELIEEIHGCRQQSRTPLSRPSRPSNLATGFIKFHFNVNGTHHTKVIESPNLYLSGYLADLSAISPLSTESRELRLARRNLKIQNKIITLYDNIFED